MNTLGLEGKKVLIRPEVAESANTNNVVVGEPRNNKESNKVLGRVIVLGKQPDGKETLKITIKNPALGGQSQVQEDVRAKFIKPKSPEVGKWKTNEVKARHKQVKPAFNMLLSKYANQATGSNSNRSSRGKHPRSPSRDKSPHHAGPYGPWAQGPWIAPPYAPYYFNGGWVQPPMATYAFHPGRAALRKSDRTT